MAKENFEDTIRQAVTPGPERVFAGATVAAASIREDKPDHTAAYGTLKIAESASVTDKTVMWLASCVKLATAVSVLQCVERGLFSLDSTADVQRLIPEWSSPDLLSANEDGSSLLTPATQKITLRTLLNHSSGLTYDFLPPLAQWRQSRGEGSQCMGKPITECFVHPLIFEPGSAWAYGSGADVAGLMVARANKCTLEAYMRRHIFDVLGMNDTSFRVSHNNIGERLMHMTVRLPGAAAVDGDPANPALVAPVNMPDDFGGGGLFGTAEDYLKLLKSILRNDGKVLKSESVDLLFEPCLSPAARASLHSSLSIPDFAAIMIPGEPLVGTEGAGSWDYGLSGLVGLHESEDGFKPGWLQWIGGPKLKWWIDREGGTCGIFATQVFPPSDTEVGKLQKLFQKEMVRKFKASN